MKQVLRVRLPHWRGEIGSAGNMDEANQPPDITPRDLVRRETPTIRDVARLAEVSIGTASKALNSAGRLSLETREKVLRIAGEIGYRPNNLAQSLHRAKSRTIGIISNDSFGRFTFPIVEALEERLADEGIAVFMCNATDDPARERQHLDQLLGKRIDGLVVTARRADKRAPISLLAHGLPVIYVFSHADDPDALSLIPDDEGGAILAVEHLAKLGRTPHRAYHRAGTFRGGSLETAGYRAALAAAGLPEIRRFLPSRASGLRPAAVRPLQNFRRGRPRPDAIFCGNDQIARGASEALRERGIGIPADVAIVGFDNWEVMALAARPP